MKLVIDKGLNCPDEAIQAQWDVQAKGFAVMASVIPEFGKQAGGWYFVLISIIAPKEAPEIQAAITKVLEQDAQAGNNTRLCGYNKAGIWKINYL